MRYRLGVITNLRAGHAAGGARKAARRAALDLPADPDLIHVVTESSAQLPQALRDLAAKEVNVLAVDGGDGTLHRVLTEVLRHGVFPSPPELAPLRGGRTNMTALDLGASRSRERSVTRLYAACRAGNLDALRVDRRTLRVDRGPGSAPLYGFFLGTGAVTRTIDFIHRVFPPGRARGVFGGGLTAAGLVLSAMFGRRGDLLVADKHRLALDGESIEAAEYLLVMATTLSRLFLRLRPFWGEGPGALRLTAIDWDARGLRRAIPRALVGRGAGLRTEDGYLSRNLHRAELRFDCGFTIDGEHFPSESEAALQVSTNSDVPFLSA